MDLIYGPIRALDIQLRDYDWFFSNFKKADVFDIHWPDAVVMGKSTPRAALKICLLLLSVLIFKLRGVRIVYHVHNIGSHDKYHPVLERFFWRVFLPNVDVFIHMNSASVTKFKEAFPSTKAQRHEVIFLPHYRDTIAAADEPRGRVRDKYGLSQDAHIYFCFGLLRPYKGLEDLIAAFDKLVEGANADNHPAELLIAGRPFDADYGNKLQQLASDNPRIKMIMRFVTDEELNELLYACDTVVMAHRKVNNSGVALMALSANRKLIAPALGALPELADIVGDMWVTLFSDLDVSILREDMGKAPVSEAGQPDLSEFEPGLLADKLAGIYRELARP